MFTPRLPKLTVGKTYFHCGYYLEKLPVPGIETWIYIGANIHDEDQESNEPRHYFERPDIYFASAIAKESERFKHDESEEDTIEFPTRMTIVQSELEGLIYDYECFREWVENLKSESNAEKVL